MRWTITTKLVATIGCLLLASCQSVSMDDDSAITPFYHWHLMVSGHSYPTPKRGIRVHIAGLSCTMDLETAKTITTPTQQWPSRWLHCQGPTHSYRIMASCRHQNQDTQRLIIAQNHQRSKQRVVELVCRRQGEGVGVDFD